MPIGGSFDRRFHEEPYSLRIGSFLFEPKHRRLRSWRHKPRGGPNAKPDQRLTCRSTRKGKDRESAPVLPALCLPQTAKAESRSASPTSFCRLGRNPPRPSGPIPAKGTRNARSPRREEEPLRLTSGARRDYQLTVPTVDARGSRSLVIKSCWSRVGLFTAQALDIAGVCRRVAFRLAITSPRVLELIPMISSRAPAISIAIQWPDCCWPDPEGCQQLGHDPLCHRPWSVGVMLAAPVGPEPMR